MAGNQTGSWGSGTESLNADGRVVSLIMSHNNLNGKLRALHKWGFHRTYEAL